MKSKLLLQFAGVFLISQFLLSCSQKEYFSFRAAEPTYQKVKDKPTPTPAPEATTAEKMVLADEPLTPVEPAPVLEANAGPAKPVLIEKKITNATQVAAVPTVKPVPVLTQSQALNTAKERLATMTKAEKRVFKQQIKQATQGTAAETSNILLIILAILIPPLAVGLYEGITTRFWISLVLTLLFFIPGAIYALLVVTDTI